MAERGIIFTYKNRQAVRDDRKFQTRRVCKNNRNSGVDIQKAEWVEKGRSIFSGLEFWTFKREMDKQHPRYGQRCPGNSIAIASIVPPYQVGDLLWMKEKWQPLYEYCRPQTGIVGACFRWRGGCRVFNCKHESSMHIDDTYNHKPAYQMPKWAAQVWLKVTKVWVEWADGKWYFVYKFKKVNNAKD